MAKKSGPINDFSTLNNAKGIKLVHINVRSLPKKIDQLRVMLHDSTIDVITISETWLKDGLVDKLFDLNGYKLFRYDRKVQVLRGKKGAGGTTKRGGGLVTYVHNRHAALSKTLDILNCSSKHLEIQWLRVHRPHCRDVLKGNWYRPPTGNLKLALDLIDETLKVFNLNKEEVFLLGDLKVDHQNKSFPDYKKLNFLVKSNGLPQLITQTTRNTVKTNSLSFLFLF